MGMAGILDTDGDSEHGDGGFLKREIRVVKLLEAVTNFRDDMTDVTRLAKARSGYWLTLMGILAMAGRTVNAVFQVLTLRTSY